MFTLFMNKAVCFTFLLQKKIGKGPSEFGRLEILNFIDLGEISWREKWQLKKILSWQVV